MPFIATNSTTVGEAVDTQFDYLLNGLYAQRQPHKGMRQSDLAANAAARRALEIIRDHLNELWCGDGDTLLRDVPIPTDANPRVIKS